MVTELRMCCFDVVREWCFGQEKSLKVCGCVVVYGFYMADSSWFLIQHVILRLHTWSSGRQQFSGVKSRRPFFLSQTCRRDPLLPPPPSKPDSSFPYRGTGSRAAVVKSPPFILHPPLQFKPVRGANSWGGTIRTAVACVEDPLNLRNTSI